MDTHERATPADRTPTALDLVRRALLSIGIIVGAVAVVAWMVKTRPVAATKPPDARPVTVGVLEVSAGPAARQVRGYGTVRALESADVTARVEGMVIGLGDGVREGVRVEAGQVLVVLDGDDPRRQLQAAIQSLAALAAQRGGLDIEERALTETLRLASEERALAHEEVERVTRAFGEGVALQRELDRARTAALAADRAVAVGQEALDMVGPRRATLMAQEEAQREAAERAKLSVERSTIAAPIAGTVQSFPLELGETVGPGTLVARVVDPSSLEVPIALPASSRNALDEGQSVRVEGADGQAAVGTIARLSPEDDPVARTLLAWVTLPDGSGLVPGAFVEGVVTAPDATPRSVVPRRSVRNERLMVIDGDRARWVPARTAYAIRLTEPCGALPDVEWLALEEPLPERSLVVLDAARRIDLNARVAPLLPGAEPEPSEPAPTEPAPSEPALPSTGASPEPSGDPGQDPAPVPEPGSVP